MINHSLQFSWKWVLYIPGANRPTYVGGKEQATCAAVICERWMSNGMKMLRTPSKLSYKSVHIKLWSVTKTVNRIDRETQSYRIL